MEMVEVLTEHRNCLNTVAESTVDDTNSKKLVGRNAAILLAADHTASQVSEWSSLGACCASNSHTDTHTTDVPNTIITV